MIARLVRTLGAAALFVLLAAMTGCSEVPTDSKAMTFANFPDRLVEAVSSNYVYFNENGAPVCWCGPKLYYDELGGYLPDAIIAIEDSRFRAHRGLDPKGLLMAVLSTIAGRTRGGSSLTSQLLKNTVLTSERSLSRKVTEALLALKLEEVMPKNKILTAYANQVAFGWKSGAPVVGVEAASALYFGRHARDMSLMEAAMIAGMLKAPSKLDPLDHYEQSRKRAEVVLNAMVENGFVTRREAAAALKAKRRPRGDLPVYRIETRSFVRWVVDEVRSERAEINLADPTVRIPITLQMLTQFKAQTAMDRAMNRLPVANPDQNAAYVAMSLSGKIISMVGQRDFEAMQINLSTALNQPASSFKPIVYAAAIEGGVKPTKRLFTAMARSDNAIAADMARKAGLENVAALAHRMGITSELRADRSLALGASEVSLLQMVGAFSTFGTGGLAAKPYGYLAIIKDGELIAVNRPMRDRVMDKSTAKSIRGMLEEVVESGTGTAAQSVDKAAGKTGTASRNTDALFIGLAADKRVSGLWIGYADNRPMPSAITGSAAAKVWAAIENSLPKE